MSWYWSIDRVIKGNKLDFEQAQSNDNPTNDDYVRQILDKDREGDGFDLYKVTSINLTHCELITDEALKIIAQKCSRLEKLFVDGCVNVTDEGIRSILMSNPNIKWLRFNGCKKVTVDIINAIITHTPNMTKIQADGVGWSVIPDDIDFGKLNRLQTFNLSDNKIKYLPQSMGNLPDSCSISIDDNPLESPPMEMANDGWMKPTTIARFYEDNPLLVTRERSSHEESYSDRGGRSDSDLSVFRPVLIENEHRIMYIATQSRHYSGQVLVVTSGMYHGKPALAAPKHFECKWTDKKTGGDRDGSFWKAIPPSSDYVALSDVAVHRSNRGIKPGVTKPAREIDSKFMCVLKSLCNKTELGSTIWTDAGSGGKYNGATWSIQGSPGMRVSRGKHDPPPQQQYTL